MKFKKLLSCFLSITMIMSMFTSMTAFVSAEDVSETVTQAVYEMDIDAIKAGSLPAGVQVNNEILDEVATSASNGLISDAMSEQTAFMQLDLEELSKNLPGEGTGLYTIEVVVNQNDSDDTTLNGMIMSMTGAAKKDVWRVRESADIAVLNSWASENSIFSSGSKHNAVASYVFTDLNVNTGAIASHQAKYGANAVYNGYANGQAVEAGNASSETPINVIEFRTATTSDGSAMRVNIKSIVITRVATLSSEAVTTVEQTVYEMDINALASGTIPTGITLNSAILDENKTSATNGLISDVVTAETEFLKVNFAELAQSLPGGDTGLYTIELVANLNDSDSSCKNGTLMYIAGEANKFAFRARESSDFCVMNGSWAQPAWNATTAAEAHYTITDLNLSTGAAVSHLAQRKSGDTLTNQYSATATGEALSAANAPITGLVFKAPANYRANIKSLKITRKALFVIETYEISAESENTTYGTVTVEGVAGGHVAGGEEVTLTATANDGYIFKGWYKSGEEYPSSTKKVWTFVATESADYIAKFAPAMEIVQTVYELDVDSLVAGRTPAGVTLNSSILDEVASSTSAGLISDAMAEKTAFLTLNLKELSKNLLGEDTGLYTIEVVANQNDEDEASLNGMIMSMTGEAKKDVWRVREGADIAVLNSWTSEDSMFGVGSKHNAVASYVFTDLNIKTGEMASHQALYGESPVYSGYANGQAVEAGNASSETPINVIEFRTATTSDGSAMRANIKSIKITRKATFSEESYVKVNQTIYEMDVDALVAGTTPAGVSLNRTILDEVSSSTATGLISDAMATQTAFLTLNLKELSKNFTGEGIGVYSIEVVANQNDADDTTLNGMFMSMAGTTQKDVWRIREGADIAVLKSWTDEGTMFSTGSKHNMIASYVFTDIDVNTGAIASHAAKYGTSPVYNGYANGQAVEAGNASDKAPINIIEFRTATTSDGGAMRVNIKSLKVTRKVLIERELCAVTAKSENNEYGTVTTEGITNGQVLGGNEVKLTATPADGYVFKCWYKKGDVTPASESKTWKFTSMESADYIARFVPAKEATQTVLELDIAAIESGAVPAGVTLTRSILDETSTSAETGLISDTVTEETQFLKLNFATLAKNLPGEDLGLYSIELVANLDDSDSATKNGILMYVDGAASKFALRARESSDFCVMNADWAQPAWNEGTGLEAYYTITDWDLSTGAAASHYAKRNDAEEGIKNQYNETATGEALNAANAPISGVTFKVPANYRANIKSIKITRKAMVEDTENAIICGFTASVKNNSVIAEATFANYSNEETKPVAVIIAQYDENGALVTTKVEEFTVNKEDGITGSKTVSQTLDSTTTFCKVFGWNAASEMIPLVKPIEVEVGE